MVAIDYETVEREVARLDLAGGLSTLLVRALMGERKFSVTIVPEVSGAKPAQNLLMVLVSLAESDQYECDVPPIVRLPVLVDPPAAAKLADNGFPGGVGDDWPVVPTSEVVAWFRSMSEDAGEPDVLSDPRYDSYVPVPANSQRAIVAMAGDLADVSDSWHDLEAVPIRGSVWRYTVSGTVWVFTRMLGGWRVYCVRHAQWATAPDGLSFRELFAQAASAMRAPAPTSRPLSKEVLEPLVAQLGLYSPADKRVLAGFLGEVPGAPVTYVRDARTSEIWVVLEPLARPADNRIPALVRFARTTTDPGVHERLRRQENQMLSGAGSTAAPTSTLDLAAWMFGRALGADESVHSLNPTWVPVSNSSRGALRPLAGDLGECVHVTQDPGAEYSWYDLLHVRHDGLLWRLSGTGTLWVFINGTFGWEVHCVPDADWATTTDGRSFREVLVAAGVLSGGIRTRAAAV